MIKFGTDGWRAVIAEDFTFENVKIVSQAIADYLKGQPAKKKKIVVGYDRRFLSKEFAETASCVFAANGIKVALSDRDVPTPTVSFHCLYGKYDLGIMITASHNPAKFNGLKIKTSEGGSADKQVTDAVEKLLGKNNPKNIDMSLARENKSIKEKDLTAEHVKFLRRLIDLKKVQKAKLKILVDNMYGSGDSFVERILKPCRSKIDYIHNEFNPSFGGIHPEPVESNVKELIARVKKDKYDLGLILDGDADRIAMVDGRGNYINAQVILPILAMHMIKNRKASGGIGKTVVGSNVIDKVALDLGVPCYETPVGFKYISNLFKQNLICIGGEEAGGIGVKGYIPERDGSVSFVLMLEMLSQEKKNFNEVLADFYRRYGRYYYSRTAIPVKSVKKSLDDMKLPKDICGKKIQRINKLDGIKLIAQDSWLMFRKSGTEPIVRVYAESRSKKESQRLVDIGTKMIYAL
ncbi:MAG: phosphoglucomutase/phosphomannomutase family protein [Candidatus Omnitrophica bacterium]|nr:phosphoglucomutase/phosphomannomutase family protein [Candidatus Omnitrophota bacterium]MDD5430076.1 phosphoglucomutase/phosphomannomutase family protein [Candidatus Omnitrophota bacterium]